MPKAKRQADDDGESEIVYVIARTADEAQEKAAAQVPDADYTMVQGFCEL